MLVFFEASLFWRTRAHSWKDRIRFLAHDLSLRWNAGSEGCKGEKRSTERTKKARSGVCLLIQSRELWHHNHPRVSTRPFQRPPDLGLFCSGSSTENFLRETGSMFIAQEPELFPLPPFLSWRPPSANMAGDAGQPAPLASRERSTRMPRGAPSPKGCASEVSCRPERLTRSVSHHSQAASGGCFVSFLISLC